MRTVTLRVFALIASLFLLALPAAAVVCGTPGRDGSGVGVTGVVNTYWGGTTGTLSAGAKSIALGDSIGASTQIQSGDLVLIMQMQDASINTSNNDRYGDGVAGGVGAGLTALNQTGIYEYARATNTVALTGGTLNLIGAGSGGGLVNAYANADATLSRGQRRYQVIRVPQYSDMSLGAALTASAWDGERGGVLAIDVAARLDLNGGTMTVSGLGFRGGGGRKLTGAGISLLSNSDYVASASAGANGSKGEGVAGTPAFAAGATGLVQSLLNLLFDTSSVPGGSYARGAPGNAGGGATDGSPFANSQNAGGGGGAGYGSGGKGGNANCGTAPTGCPTTGGFGGAGISPTPLRLPLPGGGGAASNNSGSGALGNGFGSSGAPGGGLVMIRAGVLAGTGSIFADGADASNSVLNDGSGGGGGGGGYARGGRGGRIREEVRPLGRGAAGVAVM